MQILFETVMPIPMDFSTYRSRDDDIDNRSDSSRDSGGENDDANLPGLRNRWSDNSDSEDDDNHSMVSLPRMDGGDDQSSSDEEDLPPPLDERVDSDSSSDESMPMLRDRFDSDSSSYDDSSDDDSMPPLHDRADMDSSSSESEDSMPPLHDRADSDSSFGVDDSDDDNNNGRVRTRPQGIGTRTPGQFPSGMAMRMGPMSTGMSTGMNMGPFVPPYITHEDEEVYLDEDEFQDQVGSRSGSGIFSFSREQRRRSLRDVFPRYGQMRRDSQNDLNNYTIGFDERRRMSEILDIPLEQIIDSIMSPNIREQLRNGVRLRKEATKLKRIEVECLPLVKFREDIKELEDLELIISKYFEDYPLTLVGDDANVANGNDAEDDEDDDGIGSENEHEDANDDVESMQDDASESNGVSARAPDVEISLSMNDVNDNDNITITNNNSSRNSEVHDEALSQHMNDSSIGREQDNSNDTHDPPHQSSLSSQQELNQQQSKPYDIQRLKIGYDSCVTCPVCLCEFEDGEEVRLLPHCGHIFHDDCIMPWLTGKKNTCPLCVTEVRKNKKILDENQDDDEEGTEDREREQEQEEHMIHSFEIFLNGLYGMQGALRSRRDEDFPAEPVVRNVRDVN